MNIDHINQYVTAESGTIISNLITQCKNQKLVFPEPKTQAKLNPVVSIHNDLKLNIELNDITNHLNFIPSRPFGYDQV